MADLAEALGALAAKAGVATPVRRRAVRSHEGWDVHPVTDDAGMRRVDAEFIAVAGPDVVGALVGLALAAHEKHRLAYSTVADEVHGTNPQCGCGIPAAQCDELRALLALTAVLGEGGEDEC
jgi:hypothetical protein